MTAKRIADDLRKDILTGQLRPGAELQQAQIAERFGVSRIPVRDALAVLASEKLVDVFPNRGAYVIQLTKDELREVFELRLMLETNCITEAVKVATAEDMDTADYACQRARLEAGRVGWQDGDWAFHESLYLPSKKHRHIMLIKELRQTYQVHLAAHDCLIQSTERWLHDHDALLKAFRERDGERCMGLIQQHLDGALEVLLAQMD